MVLLYVSLVIITFLLGDLNNCDEYTCNEIIHIWTAVVDESEE